MTGSEGERSPAWFELGTLYFMVGLLTPNPEGALQKMIANDFLYLLTFCSCSASEEVELEDAKNINICWLDWCYRLEFHFRVFLRVAQTQV